MEEDSKYGGRRHKSWQVRDMTGIRRGPLPEKGAYILRTYENQSSICMYEF